MTHYLLAGGGTAGHVNPLLAVADEIVRRNPNDRVTVLGTAEGLEARLVPLRGYTLEVIPRLPFPRTVSRYALTFARKFPQAVAHTAAFIKREHVDVVIGFGGYAAAPAYRAARKTGIPLIIHEANALPGLANRLGSKYATAVATTFSNTPIKGATTVGMPLRNEVATLDRAALRAEARAEFALDADRPAVLVFGGSQGARTINTALAGAYASIVEAGGQVLHVVGPKNEGTTSIAGVTVVNYVDRMDLAYAAADLVLARSGAATVSELSTVGLPAIYVPYPVGNGEQRLNAASVVDAGGALLVPDAELTPEWVSTTVPALLADAAKREEMSRNARAFGSAGAAAAVVDLAERALGRSSEVTNEDTHDQA